MKHENSWQQKVKNLESKHLNILMDAVKEFLESKTEEQEIKAVTRLARTYDTIFFFDLEKEVLDVKRFSLR